MFRSALVAAVAGSAAAFAPTAPLAGRATTRAGAMFQDIAVDPSYASIVGGAKMTAAHDVLVKQGAMGQLLLWLSFLEVFGTIALFETLEGMRAPGDFKFDPLGFGKKPETAARYALAEIKNGRLAMMGIGGMVHGYFLTGKGPLELLGYFLTGKGP